MITEEAAGGGAVDIGHTVADAPVGPTQTLPPHAAAATTSSTATSRAILCTRSTARLATRDQICFKNVNGATKPRRWAARSSIGSTKYA